MILFWFAMMPFCCAIVSFRLAISTASSPIPAYPPSVAPLGVSEMRLSGNGGSSWCVVRRCVLASSSFSGSCDAVAPLPACSSRAAAAVLVVGSCWASSAFAVCVLVR